MSVRLAEPDYQLVWPRALFRAEAAKLLNRRELKDWNDRCELLLDDAFVRGYEGGPLSEFRDVTDDFVDNRWGTREPRSRLTAKQQFLRDLMGKTDHLHEDASHRRPYWRERGAGQRNAVVLSNVAVVREFIALIGDIENAGYFEKRSVRIASMTPTATGPLS